MLWWDRAESALRYESREAADIADPIDPAEAKEPTLANDAKEAALPIERTEFSDQRDHTPSSVARRGGTDALFPAANGPAWQPTFLRGAGHGLGDDGAYLPRTGVHVEASGPVTAYTRGPSAR